MKDIQDEPGAWTKLKKWFGLEFEILWQWEEDDLYMVALKNYGYLDGTEPNHIVEMMSRINVVRIWSLANFKPELKRDNPNAWALSHDVDKVWKDIKVQKE